MSRRLRSALILTLPPCVVAALLGWQAHRHNRQYWLDRHLCSAVKAEEVASVRELLRQGADPNTRELQRPAPDGFVARVQQMLHPPRQDTDSMCPLHRACCLGNLAMVDLLIRADADVNAVADETDSTPIECAGGAQADRIIRRLLESGADPNYRGRSRYAVEMRRILMDCDSDTVEYAIKHGGRLSDPPESSLASASMNRDPAVTQLLLDRGYDPNVRCGGYTPLSTATMNGNLAVAKLLVKRGARVNQLNSDGRTPIGLAMYLRRSMTAEDSVQLDRTVAYLRSIGGH